MKRDLLKIFALLLLFTIVYGCCNPQEEQPKRAKYIFYFIGDGMGFSHVALTEAYKAQLNGKEFGSDPLLFTQFPAMGMATTYSASNPITCSSAAGTALSTGSKTRNGFLGVTPDSVKLTSISYKLHNAGYKVGVATTVTIDHATPGAFYAASPDRNDYLTVALQLPKSGFEFFGGGGFQGAKPRKGDERSAQELNSLIFSAIDSAGYSVAYGIEDFKSKRASGAEKVILFQSDSAKVNEILPYALLRDSSDLTLKDVVTAAIEVLNNENGFFMMMEGGKIDWAAHSNDVANTIYETLDMDEAIAVAYEFYKAHPEETLIVVTADHETGGVALGREKGYFFDLHNILEQSKNASALGTNVEDYMKVTPVKEVSEESRIGWTTHSHTGGAVPVFAVGAGSEAFIGRMDNTDIPKRICAAAGVEF